MKKYRCPKDATASDKMEVLLLPLTLRTASFPNEILHCPTCNKLYRWDELKEMSII